MTGRLWSNRREAGEECDLIQREAQRDRQRCQRRKANRLCGCRLGFNLRNEARGVVTGASQRRLREAQSVSGLRQNLPDRTARHTGQVNSSRPPRLFPIGIVLCILYTTSPEKRLLIQRR